MDFFDKNVFHLTHERLISNTLLSLLLLVQHVETPLLLGLGNVIRFSDSRGARPGRIEENEEPVIVGGADDFAGRLKILFRFAWVANDDVGGQGKILTIRAKKSQSVQILSRRITAAHVGKDAIGPGLHRQMEIGSETRQFGETPGKLLFDVRGMRGRETKTPKPVIRVMNQAEQI
ncbi:MAG: hypothetical protein ABIR28_08655, partial [Vicinamibacteria bacterium]